MPSKQAKRDIFLGYTTVFLDVLGFSLVVPILPFICDNMKATSMQEGFLFSGYCVTQLISLVVMGNLSDYYGRKPFFLLSLLGSCVGAIAQGLCTDMWSLIFWRCMTGLFAGSSIVAQALTADCTSPEERNRYIAWLEAVVNAAYIIGPALGGIFGQINLSLPLYIAGVVAGIAMILTWIFLEESNKDVLEIIKLKKELKTLSGDEKTVLVAKIKNRNTEIDNRHKSIHVRPNKLMILCFIFEFFNRWTINAFDSRYGIFLKDKFNISQSLFAYITGAQSGWLCIQQGFIYGFIVNSCHVPIPILACIGAIIEGVSYYFMSAASTMWGSIAACSVLWVGFGFAAPTAASIISTSNAPEVQGKVLSWNNFCSQSSLIICPLILAAIYVRNAEATYYFCCLISLGATITMGFMMSMPNMKTFGKSAGPNAVNASNESETKEIELEEVEKDQKEMSAEVISVGEKVNAAPNLVVVRMDYADPKPNVTSI